MSCLPSYTLYYDIPLTIWPAAARGVHLPGKKDWRLPGRTLQNREGKPFIFIYFADEEGQCCQDVFAV